MSRIYLPENASRPQMKAAREAQKERRDILKALSHRQVSRRDLIRAGLFTAGGLLAPIRGLHSYRERGEAVG